MRVLWLTRRVPVPPFYGGDALYSAGLIRATSQDQHISDVTVVSRTAGAALPDWPGVQWRTVATDESTGPGRLTSPLPSIAYRSVTRDVREAYRDALASGAWDVVVVDGLPMAPLLDRSPGCAVVYIAHNHETSLRASIASADRHPVRRMALALDARKAARLEGALVRRAEVITAITEEDRMRFQRGAPDRTTMVLAPGYDGPRRLERHIGPETPRRVLILGSFHWVAKQVNLHRVLAAIAGPLGEAGVELEVAGGIPQRLQKQLTRSYPSVVFHADVASTDRFLDTARLGVVAEPLGGGFKLKALDYVFGRVPIVALDGGTTGVPLQPDRSVLVSPDLEGIPDLVLRHIDDLSTLNALHEAAFAACADAFHWSERGALLAQAFQLAVERHARAGHGQLADQ